MAKEIERRFLVDEGFSPSFVADGWVNIEQSYLSDTGDWTIRLRKVDGPKQDSPMYFVTMKQFVFNATNHEIEFQISEEAYLDMHLYTKASLRKRRWYISYGNHRWEVDVYIDAPDDFQTICEVELKDENEKLSIPPWVKREVTGDRSFSNAALAERLAQS